MEPQSREQHIRARAYALWEQQGRPAGKDAEHWAEARRQIEEETRSSGMAGSDGTPDLPPESLQHDLSEGDPIERQLERTDAAGMKRARKSPRRSAG